MSAADEHYAGFWRRTAATVIDNVILIPVFALLSTSLFASPASAPLSLEVGPREIHALQQQLAQQSVPVLIGVALIVFFWVRFMGTPGKLLLHCHVVDALTGRGMTVAQALLRYLGYVLSVLTLGIGFLWIAWDPRKQGLHDKLAGTVVIVTEHGSRT